MGTGPNIHEHPLNWTFVLAEFSTIKPCKCGIVFASSASIFTYHLYAVFFFFCSDNIALGNRHPQAYFLTMWANPVL